jgi:hypothetical protein
MDVTTQNCPRARPICARHPTRLKVDCDTNPTTDCRYCKCCQRGLDYPDSTKTGYCRICRQRHGIPTRETARSTWR